METAKKIFNSLALNEDTDETEQAKENEKNHEDYNEEKAERELEPYTIPAHQNGDDVVDEETVFPKEEEADFTSGVME